VICVAQYRLLPSSPAPPARATEARNPLELGTAAIFAALFVLISLVSTWVTAEFGTAGTYALAAVVGFADIDPFVLNLAQGGTSGISGAAAAAAILIAASSNNLLKAGYASVFAGGRATASAAVALVGLAAAGIAIAIGMGMS
jgi:uncharacterized membrane protein (DUF4010 family)